MLAGKIESFLKNTQFVILKISVKGYIVGKMKMVISTKSLLNYMTIIIWQ